MIRKNLVFLFMFLLLMLLSSPSNALTIAGINLDDNAFVDEVISYGGSLSGPYGTSGIVGSDMDTYVTLLSGSFLEVAFTNNTLYNGAGYDAVFFELAAPESSNVAVEFGGSVVTVAMTNSGYYSPGHHYQINVGYLELSLLGIAENETVDNLIIYGNSGQDLSGVAALNNDPVPEPATMLLLGSGLMGLAGYRRKIKKV